MANSTVSGIIGQAEGLLKLEGDDLGLSALGSTLGISFVNKLNIDFFDEFHNVGASLPSYMKGEKGFDAVDSTKLNGAVAAGANSITVDDSSDFESANGAGVIRVSTAYDVFDYTTNDGATVFTGVTNVDFAHADDTTVSRLYRLPDNFDIPRTGRRKGHGVTVNDVPYFQTAENPLYNEFAIYDNGTYKFLWLPKGVTSGNIMVVYDKKPTTLDSDDDTVDVPVEHEDYLVYGLVAKWKRTIKQNANIDFEMAMQQRVLQRAFSKKSVGKIVRAANAFFNRKRGVPMHNVFTDE